MAIVLAGLLASHADSLLRDAIQGAFGLDDPSILRGEMDIAEINERLRGVKRVSPNIKNKSSGMETVGVTTMKGPDKIHDGWKYVKAVSDLPTVNINADDTQNNHFMIGVFNPVEILNAQYAVESITSFSEEWSSSFSGDASAEAIPVQWPTPEPLNAYIAELAATTRGYNFYNCEFVTVALEFTSLHATDDIEILYKMYWPGDERARNHTTNMDDGSTVDGDSHRNLVEGTANATYQLLHDDVTLRNWNELTHTGGMKRMRLGPNTTNGLPNVGRTGFQINVKEILNKTSYTEFIPIEGDGLLTDLESMPHLGNKMTKTAAAAAVSSIPIVLIFAAHVSVTGGINAIPISTLLVRGRAEYTVRLFGREQEVIAVMDDPQA